MAASAAACPFCQPAQLVTQNNLAYAVVDKHPVTPGHALIVPYRQVADYFDTTQAEKVVLRSLFDAVKTILDAKPQPTGYNIGGCQTDDYACPYSSDPALPWRHGRA